MDSCVARLLGIFRPGRAFSLAVGVSVGGRRTVRRCGRGTGRQRTVPAVPTKLLTTGLLPTALALNPLAVGWRSYAGETPLVAKEIFEIGQDVAERIRKYESKPK